MLDEGVHVELFDLGDGTYTLRVSVEDQGCADCLVPDEMLSAIAGEALRRHGSEPASVTVEHTGSVAHPVE